MDVGLAGHHAGIVHQIAGGEVVAAVHHDVVVLDDLHDVLGGEPLRDRDHVDVRVQPLERLARRFGLGLADAVVAVEDLALQVGQVHHVVVDDAHGADAGRGQVIGGRRTQAARSHHQHPCVQELRLALFADLGQQEVAAVAGELLLGELPVLDERVALVLPGGVSAGHGDHVLVAHLLHDLAGEKRPHAAGAVGDDGGRLVRHLGVHLHFEEASWDRHRVLQVSFPVFLFLAHVQEHVVAVVPQQLVHLLRRQLLDGAACLVHQLLKCLGHDLSPAGRRRHRYVKQGSRRVLRRLPRRKQTFNRLL